jgi:hypothetical protein
MTPRVGTCKRHKHKFTLLYAAMVDTHKREHFHACFDARFDQLGEDA